MGKTPTAEQLDYGQIAINYNAEEPFLAIKDSNDNIQKIPTAEVCYIEPQIVKDNTESYYYVPADTSSTTYDIFSEAARAHKIILLGDKVLTNITKQYASSGDLHWYDFEYYLGSSLISLSLYSDGHCTGGINTTFQNIKHYETINIGKRFSQENFNLGDETMSAYIISENAGWKSDYPKFLNGLPISCYYDYKFLDHTIACFDYDGFYYVYMNTTKYTGGKYIENSKINLIGKFRHAMPYITDWFFNGPSANTYSREIALIKDFLFRDIVVTQYTGMYHTREGWVNASGTVSNGDKHAVSSQAVYNALQNYATTASTANFIKKTDDITIDCGTF